VLDRVPAGSRVGAYSQLRASFRPDAEIAALRDYLRQRERLLDYAAAHIQHMQKALTQMNLQPHASPHFASVTEVVGGGPRRSGLDRMTDGW